MNTNENETAAANQCDRILHHLKTGASITAIEALNMFGCFRLASATSPATSAVKHFHAC